MEIVGVAVVAVLLVALVTAFARQLAFNRINHLYLAGDPEALLAYLDRPLVKTLYPEYNRSYMMLNAYLVKGDVRRAGELFDELLPRAAAGEQRDDLVVKAFGFYMDEGAFDKAAGLLGYLDELADQGLADECRQMYEILAQKSCAYIEMMEKRLEMEEGEDKLKTCLLLSAQYENTGDKAGAERYLSMMSSVFASEGSVSEGLLKS